jgi:glycosidase
MMNVAATHDSPRLSTSLFNKTMDKYNAKPSDNPDYKINKPDQTTRQEQLLLLVHQFTFIGAPHIWNGDEAGMWGADDPDCRKPIVWDDIKYEDERANFNPEKSRPVDVVSPDTALLSFYKKLVLMRKENPVLIYGDLNFTIMDDQKMVFAYTRKMDNKEITVVFNRSGKIQTITLTGLKSMDYENILSTGGNLIKDTDSGTEITLEPLSAVVLKCVKIQ